MHSFRRFYSTVTRKRFYKDVSVVNSVAPEFSKSNSYEICLDDRKFRTPKRKVLVVPSEPLALAVAHEWSSQKQTVKLSDLHFTSLSVTCTDNPMNKTSSDIVQNILTYFDNDSLLYFNSESESLFELQKKSWMPIIEWANEYFGVKIEPSFTLDGPAIDRLCRRKIEFHLKSYDFWPLIGLEYGVEVVKSSLLTLAVARCRLSVEEAVRLANLEQNFQIERWGKVEWAHDVDFHEQCSRFSAAILFTRWTSAKN
uniref:ATP synthase mitochondrial F1 complex assembly factor 2 n=1 Tax=Romanomermis culicivorax TaxID=13658 RepID=A0A915J6J8_ROMCU